MLQKVYAVVRQLYDEQSKPHGIEIIALKLSLGAANSVKEQSQDLRVVRYIADKDPILLNSATEMES